MMTMQDRIGVAPIRREYEPPAPPHERSGLAQLQGGHLGAWSVLTSPREVANVERRPRNVQSGTWTSTPTTWTSGWIVDALKELAEIDDEIAEERFPEIGSTVKDEAERILKSLAWHPLTPAVYPTSDAEIAIQLQSSGSPGSVLILLNNDGQADCYAHFRGRNRRAHYDAASDLPDDFLREQLRALTGERPAIQARMAGWLGLTSFAAMAPQGFGKAP